MTEDSPGALSYYICTVIIAHNLHEKAHYVKRIIPLRDSLSFRKEYNVYYVLYVEIRKHSYNLAE